MKIVLVAPSGFSEWGEIFKEALASHNSYIGSPYGNVEFELETIYVEDYIDFQSFAVDDADALIGRGTAVMELRRLTEIPVVQIPITNHTIERSVLKVVELYNPQKIAVVGNYFNKMINVDAISRSTGANIHLYTMSGGQPANTKDEIERGVWQAVDEGCDAFICGIYGYEFCKKQGLNVVCNDITHQEAWCALNDAKHSAYVYRCQRLKSELYKSVLNYSFQGIVSLDENMEIQFCNAAAGQILIGAEKSAANSNMMIRNKLEDLGIIKHAGDRIKYTDMIFSQKDTHFMVNIIPIFGKDKYGGSVVLIQDISKIQKQENQIRSKLHARGHIAKYTFDDVKGESKAIRDVIEMAKVYSKAESSILIYGKTGTGKEVFAQSIHNNSLRSRGPFVAVNCAALPEHLLESELFGYVDGAFTGASKSGKLGYFLLAHNGTIFLDEIAEIPLTIQSKLLRVIQEKEINRLGDDKVTPVNVRVLCATNKNLEHMVSAGSFREDLYYRLSVLQIDLPPISSRTEDIPILAKMFLEEFSIKNSKQIKIKDSVYRELQSTEWKGNIRQLRNICERIVIICRDGFATGEDVRRAFLNQYQQPAGNLTACTSTDDQSAYDMKKSKAQSILDSIERSRIQDALQHAKGNREEAAGVLGISRATMYRKMKKYGITC